MIPSSPEGPADPERLSILLVEDCPESREALSYVLGRRGHRVTAAADLAAARLAAGSGPFDVMVCDLMLPDGSALDLMEDLRGAVPGVVLSGHDGEDDRRQTRAAGFAAHLAKPVTADRLEATLRRVVRLASH